MCAVRVWAYVCTSETTTTITVTCGSVTSTSFLLTPFWDLVASFKGRARTFQLLRWPHREKRVSRVFPLLASSFPLAPPPRSELPGWPWSYTCHLPAPPSSSGPWGHLCPLQPPGGMPQLKGPWTIEGQNSPLSTVMSGYILIAPSIKSTVSKELFLILLDVVWILLG